MKQFTFDPRKRCAGLRVVCEALLCAVDDVELTESATTPGQNHGEQGVAADVELTESATTPGQNRGEQGVAADVELKESATTPGQNRGEQGVV